MPVRCRCIDRALLLTREGVNLRPTAGKAIKKANFQYVAVQSSDEVGRSFKENSADWNMELAAEVEGIYLFRIR